MLLIFQQLFSLAMSSSPLLGTEEEFIDNLRSQAACCLEPHQRRNIESLDKVFKGIHSSLFENFTTVIELRRLETLSLTEPVFDLVSEEKDVIGQRGKTELIWAGFGSDSTKSEDVLRLFVLELVENKLMFYQRSRLVSEVDLRLCSVEFQERALYNNHQLDLRQSSRESSSPSRIVLKSGVGFCFDPLSGNTAEKRFATRKADVYELFLSADEIGSTTRWFQLFEEVKQKQAPYFQSEVLVCVFLSVPGEPVLKLNGVGSQRRASRKERKRIMLQLRAKATLSEQEIIFEVTPGSRLGRRTGLCKEKQPLQQEMRYRLDLRNISGFSTDVGSSASSWFSWKRYFLQHFPVRWLPPFTRLKAQTSEEPTRCKDLQKISRQIENKERKQLDEQRVYRITLEPNADSIYRNQRVALLFTNRMLFSDWFQVLHRTIHDRNDSKN